MFLDPGFWRERVAWYSQNFTGIEDQHHWFQLPAALGATLVMSDFSTLWTSSPQATLSMGLPGKNTLEGCHALPGTFPTQIKYIPLCLLYRQAFTC